MTIPNYFDEFKSCLNCDAKDDQTYRCRKCQEIGNNKYWSPNQGK